MGTKRGERFIGIFIASVFVH